jgi:predicted  nucleic acid-binding Zn-ribbon protein
MQSVEGLQELHSLNWLERLAVTLPAGKARQKEVKAKITELRSRLPVALLTHHDRMLRQKRPSVVRTSGNGCGNCHLRLPMSTVHELLKPRGFALCPNCGVFVTMNAPAAEVLEQEKRTTTPKAL